MFAYSNLVEYQANNVTILNIATVRKLRNNVIQEVPVVTYDPADSANLLALQMKTRKMIGTFGAVLFRPYVTLLFSTAHSSSPLPRISPADRQDVGLANIIASFKRNDSAAKTLGDRDDSENLYACTIRPSHQQTRAYNVPGSTDSPHVYTVLRDRSKLSRLTRLYKSLYPKASVLEIALGAELGFLPSGYDGTDSLAKYELETFPLDPTTGSDTRLYANGVGGKCPVPFPIYTR